MYGLEEGQIQQIRAVFGRCPEVEAAVLYGSRAMGTNRYNSDIDLSLKGDTLSFATLLDIENELDDLLLPYKIDLSIFRHVDNPELLEHIEQKGVVLYEKGKALASE